ncbi:two-component sensor histidine kinase [Nocardioides sp. BGMRC 2183]|nr:two-component sensor histidine kinase [Nocardioides sp. BGMRC 2183]
MLAWHLSERQQRRHPEPVEPLLPAGVATVLSVLRSSAVVLDESDAVVKASAPAYAMGVVRDGALVSAELGQIVREVRRDGQIRETELTMTSSMSSTPGPPRTVTARVAPLGPRLVLALVEDRTKERQVEAVRRDFVANVSHELKTPVGAIHLLAEAVQDAADDPEAVHRFAARMQTESDRLGKLVQQIIELSRLQGDDPVASPSPVAIDDVIATAIDTSAMEAGAKHIALLTEGEEGLKILGKEDQVTAAVSNLVANAVAYSEERSRVLLSRRSVGPAVEISVIDQGIGIPDEEVDRIFERFYRVDPARHRSTGGTGLGLSIVKHVAATHGGEVRVWSVEGQGSTFTLSLPKHPGYQALNEPPVASAGAHATPPQQEEDRP